MVALPSDWLSVIGELGVYGLANQIPRKPRAPILV
jgi:hypothetical protein